MTVYVGAIVHKVLNGVCQPVIVQSIERVWDDENNKPGPNKLGKIAHSPLQSDRSINAEHSEENYFEGTWHKAETCTTKSNFVQQEE